MVVTGMLIQIRTDARLRTGVVAVAAADHAAHVDVRVAGLPVAALTLAARVGNARRILHVVVEIDDVQLLELLAVEHLDADRHVLQVLDALLRRDDDLLEPGARTGRGVRRFLRVRRRPCREQRQVNSDPDRGPGVAGPLRVFCVDYAS